MTNLHWFCNCLSLQSTAFNHLFVVWLAASEVQWLPISGRCPQWQPTCPRLQHYHCLTLHWYMATSVPKSKQQDMFFFTGNTSICPEEDEYDIIISNTRIPIGRGNNLFNILHEIFRLSSPVMVTDPSHANFPTRHNPFFVVHFTLHCIAVTFVLIIGF